MSNDPFNPTYFANCLMGPDDERKKHCIHCNEEVYEVNLNDGVCPDCRDKNLPGRSVLEKRAERRRNTIMIVSIIVLYLIIRFLSQIHVH